MGRSRGTACSKCGVHPCKATNFKCECQVQPATNVNSGGAPAKENATTKRRKKAGSSAKKKPNDDGTAAAEVSASSASSNCVVGLGTAASSNKGGTVAGATGVQSCASINDCNASVGPDSHCAKCKKELHAACCPNHRCQSGQPAASPLKGVTFPRMGEDPFVVCAKRSTAKMQFKGQVSNGWLCDEDQLRPPVRWLWGEGACAMCTTSAKLRNGGEP